MITVIIFGVEYAMTIEAYQWFVSGMVGLLWILAAGLAYVVGHSGPDCRNTGSEYEDVCDPILNGG
jgi:hypothetical protein